MENGLFHCAEETSLLMPEKPNTHSVSHSTGDQGKLFHILYSQQPVTRGGTLLMMRRM